MAILNSQIINKDTRDVQSSSTFSKVLYKNDSLAEVLM